VPTYEYHCRDCHTTFELIRPMAQSSDPASCPDGHADTVKLLNTIGMIGDGKLRPPPKGKTRPRDPGLTKANDPRFPGGTCCGGSCGRAKSM
jgi:putative FmdB family regulatory protein